MPKKPSYQIPFDKDGNQLDYDDWRVAKWKDIYEFTDTLTYNGYGRGRSSATLHFTDSTGHTYSMFLSDFDDMMRDGGFDGMKVTGTFTFVKKGQNYGVRKVIGGAA